MTTASTSYWTGTIGDIVALLVLIGLKVELRGWASFGGHGQTTTCFFVKPAARSAR